jgi:protein-tyrosine phosphatase
MFDIVDIHNHSLYGLDDGADSYETMCGMIDASYSSGVRHICFTPHYFNVGDRDCTPEMIKKSFGEAVEYCKEKYPDMILDVGSEMIYHFDCGVALSSKKLFTIADSRYVLVDFLATPDARGIVLGTERLLNLGYIPIVAHVERYPCLWNKIDKIRHMSELGAVIQINAASLSGGLFSKSKRQCVKLLSQELVDVVASDAHDLTERTPNLEAAVKFVISKFGEEYAEHIFSTVPKKIISNQRI